MDKASRQWPDCMCLSGLSTCVARFCELTCGPTQKQSNQLVSVFSEAERPQASSKATQLLLPTFLHERVHELPGSVHPTKPRAAQKLSWRPEHVPA